MRAAALPQLLLILNDDLPRMAMVFEAQYNHFLVVCKITLVILVIVL